MQSLKMSDLVVSVVRIQTVSCHLLTFNPFSFIQITLNKGKILDVFSVTKPWALLANKLDTPGARPSTKGY